MLFFFKKYLGSVHLTKLYITSTLNSLCNAINVISLLLEDITFDSNSNVPSFVILSDT